MNDEPLEKYVDRISAFYDGRTVLITGGTGFIGKVLLEKILRTCSGVHKIYLLLRPKKNKSAEERIKEIFDGPLFDMLRNEKGDSIFNKVEPIHAILDAPDLGLSQEDRTKISNEVNFIYHCAACVRFDLPLKEATLLNVRGTKLMLDLAKECPNLITFIHVSTAYCHVLEKVLLEKTYDPPFDPYKLIDMCEWMKEDVLEDLKPKLLGEIPNTYCFTKALGEGVVNDQMDKLPVIILRPSIVIPIWKEPLPGWTDNINGPTGLLIGAGKGVIRTMYCDSNSCGDYLPADILVNAMLVSAFDFCYNKGIRRVYNITSSAEYKVSFQDIIEIGMDVIEKRVPLNWVVWYPGGKLQNSRVINAIYFYLFQILPAILVDGLLLLLGVKPILMRVQRRIAKGYQMFDYYVNRQWEFNSDGSMEARETLNPYERIKYKLDGNGIDYYQYFTTCVHAARLYILKETDESLPVAKRHMKVMWCVDKFCKALIIFGFFYFLWTKLFVPIFMTSID